MERLTKSGVVSQKDINELLEPSDENQFGMNDAYYKLKSYEDLEEKLFETYGECEGLLETAIDYLCKYSIDLGMGKPKKSILLTDEDCDKWHEYKDLEEQGLLLKLPCKVGDELWIIAYRDNKVISVKCTGYTLQKDTVNKINHSYIWVDSVEKPGDYWWINFEDFKTYCFPTKEEAEKALAEMEE